MRSKDLSFLDAEDLASDGGQLIPMMKASRIFECVEQGVELSPGQRVVFAVRHVEGNYDDKLDDLGRFTYHPPANLTGMIRYRWCEALQQGLDVPLIVLAVMWFNYESMPGSRQVFVVCPAKIIHDSTRSSLDSDLAAPLSLQLVSRGEAISAINRCLALADKDSTEIDVRAELAVSIAREWAYQNLVGKNKGRALKRWAIERNLSCPGDRCGHQSFSQAGGL